MQKRNDFLQFFPNCTGSSQYLIPQLLKRNAEKAEIHSAIWKFFLIILPNTTKSAVKASDWVSILKQKRTEFFKLKAEHFVEAPDDDAADPLLTSQDPRWAAFFRDQELRQQIKLDTARAFQEMEFFHNQTILELLEDILFLFCKAHPSYGYPQGLHELAAFILYVFYTEMNATENDPISFIFHSSAVVPDAYFTFSALAEAMEPLYQANDAKNSGFCANLANSIQGEKLSKESRAVSNALAGADVCASSYMLHWLRLLFLRVFDLESVKSMWDLIFAYLPNIDVISYTCVAMLLDVGPTIVHSDSTGIFQLLFRYPKDPHPIRFVAKAIEMMQRGEQKEKSDVTTAISERLNELARELNDVCSKFGYEEALPFVMDIRRTRDVLLGILPIEELMPLEQAIELYKPSNIEFAVEEDLLKDLDSKPEPERGVNLEMMKASSKTQAKGGSTKLLFEIDDKQNTPKVTKKNLSGVKHHELKKNDSLFESDEKPNDFNKNKIELIKQKPKNNNALFDFDDKPVKKKNTTNSDLLFAESSKPQKNTVFEQKTTGILFEEEKSNKQKAKSSKAKIVHKTPSDLFS